MVDYSKWKNIEISDDEDETHPNIDTPSLFRWRHQARVEHMEEQKKDVDDYEKKKADYQKKMTAAKEKISDAKKTDSTNLAELQQALNELEKENEKNEKMGNELLNKEKKTPWNIDTISKPGFAKTLINVNPVTLGDSNLSEEQRESRMQKFFKEHEKELKHYGLLRKYEDSRAYLRAHDFLVSEYTANYLVISCINLEMEQKHDLMEHVAHQMICIQYILELAKQLKCDPRACLDMFFAKIQVAEPKYRAVFEDELRQFKERIVRRCEN